MTQQPHARLAYENTATRKIVPHKIVIVGRVHPAAEAIAVPESAPEWHSAVEVRVFRLIVVAVVSAEHGAVVVCH